MLSLTGPHSDFACIPHSMAMFNSIYFSSVWFGVGAPEEPSCNALLTRVYKAKVAFLEKVSIHTYNIATLLLIHEFNAALFFLPCSPASFTGAIRRHRSRFCCERFQTYSADTRVHWQSPRCRLLHA